MKEFKLNKSETNRRKRRERSRRTKEEELEEEEGDKMGSRPLIPAAAAVL